MRESDLTDLRDVMVTILASSFSTEGEPSLRAAQTRGV